MALTGKDIGGQFRHKKTGHLYILVGFARLESDLSYQAIYRLWTGNGPLDFWVRPVKEFADRFEKVSLSGSRLTEQILQQSENSQTD